MKVKTKKVYYCDFCQKHSLSAGHCSNHEKRCTANPDRECQLCGKRSISHLIEKYKDAYEIKRLKEVIGGIETPNLKIIWKKKFALEHIKIVVDYCPNCVLTILRCCKLNLFPVSSKFHFDYQEELKAWWEAKNEELMNDY